MLVIRFFRVGKKNQPSFKIVVTDKRKPPRSGRFTEEVGFYNPLTKEKVLNQERIKYWLSVGAKPSDTVYNLLISEKIVEGKKTPVHKKAKERKEEASTPEAPAPEVPKEEAPKKEEKPVEEKPAEEKPTEEIQKEEKKEPEAETQTENESAAEIKKEEPSPAEKPTEEVPKLPDTNNLEDNKKTE